MNDKNQIDIDYHYKRNNEPLLKVFTAQMINEACVCKQQCYDSSNSDMHMSPYYVKWDLNVHWHSLPYFVLYILRTERL